jgi:hypothetical protein
LFLIAEMSYTFTSYAKAATETEVAFGLSFACVFNLDQISWIKINLSFENDCNTIGDGSTIILRKFGFERFLVLYNYG